AALRAAGMEDLRRLALIGAQLERRLAVARAAQHHVEGRARQIAREGLDRIADADQGLLDGAALAPAHHQPIPPAPLQLDLEPATGSRSGARGWRTGRRAAGRLATGAPADHRGARA